MLPAQIEVAGWDFYADGVLSGNIPVCPLIKLACERYKQDREREKTDWPYRFSASKASKAIRFFSALNLTKALRRPRPFVPEPWQQFVVAQLFGWVRKDDDFRRFRNGLVMVPRKNGKALALDTRISTPHGVKTMSDLHEGDLIFGADGRQYPVVAESEIFFGHDCYQVRFSTGEIITADAGHLWETTGTNQPGATVGRVFMRDGIACDKPHLRTTEELSRTLRRGSRNDLNHSIRVASGVQCADREFVVAPYALGVWLGDGDSGSSQFCTMDHEIVLKFSECEPETQEYPGRSKGRAKTYKAVRGKVPFQTRLRQIGVFRNKHIPEEYFLGSWSQRLELLRGLMDTDGSCSKVGQCCFSNTNERLARGAMRLICSLGFKASIREDDAVLNGRWISKAFDVQFWSDSSVRVFHVERKWSRQKQEIGRSARSRTRKIVSVEKVSSVPTKCIQVGSPDGMFLCGDSYIPTHNSHLMAGIGLYGLVADDEMGAEVYSVATKKDQARMIFDAAVEFRRHSGSMKDFLTFKNNTLSVIATSSKFQALSSDEDGLDGLNVHIGLVDEFQNHKTMTVVERVATGTGGRSQPIVLKVGTAGTDRLSPCGRERDMAVRILHGDAEDDTYLAFVSEADDEDDWEDEATWRRVNPNLGVSVNIEDLRAKAREAKNEPSKLNSFLRLHLNRWTQQEYVYIPMHRWRECAGEVKVTADDGKVVLVDPKDRVAVESAMLAQWRLPFAGMDLSSKDDLTALVNLFPPSANDPRWVVTCRFWVPQEGVAKRVKMDRVPYDMWIKQGLISATPGEVVDYDFVEAEVLELFRKLHHQGLGCDPWNAIQLITRLRGQGVPIVEVQQSFRALSDPTKELLSWVLSRKLAHLNDQVLTWNAGNMAVASDPAGNVKPNKELARERMDGMAALVNAIHVAQAKSQSIYANRGILSI